MQYLFNLKVCRCDSKKEGGASGRRKSKSLRRIHFLALAIAYKIQLKDTIVGLHSMREGVKNL